jgi:3-methyladenine DNA glycosylase/8-oxoguanine DNA glycosylase
VSESERRTFVLDAALDLEATTLVGDFGRSHPCVRRLAKGELARAVATPEGPATLHVRVGGGRVEVQAWGPGRAALLARVPDHLGLDDRVPVLGGRLAQLEARHPGVRSSRALELVELVQAQVIRQRVAWRDAVHTQRSLLRAHAHAAPGPFELLVPLSPAQWATLGASDLAAFGLERKRASTLLDVAARADRIRGWAESLAPDEFGRKLELLPGIGPWTSGMVRGIGLGDPDVAPTGDYELPSMVSHALADEPRGDDARMLELLEPWRGHRFRVIKLLWAAGIMAPRHGPRIRGTEPGRRGF